jgi:hypothetical protein
MRGFFTGVLMSPLVLIGIGALFKWPWLLLVPVVLVLAGVVVAMIRPAGAADLATLQRLPPLRRRRRGRR